VPHCESRTRMSISPFGFAAVISTLLAFQIGCIGSPAQADLSTEHPLESQSTRGLADAKLSLSGSALTRGNNDLVLDLTANSGSLPPTLTNVVAIMPAHGHSSTPEAVDSSGSEYQILQLPLFMSGAWQIQCDFTVGGSPDSVAFDVDVP